MGRSLGAAAVMLPQTGLGDGERAVYIPTAPCPALAAALIALSPLRDSSARAPN